MSRIVFDEAKLVEQIIDGDEEAFKKLYLKYIDQIYNFVLSICKSPELSSDVCHEVFVKVWSLREKLISENSFKSFLFTIAKNHVLNVIKRASKQREIYYQIKRNMDHSQQRFVEEEFLYSELSDLVNSAIDILPPQRRKIYELSRIEGLTHHEIAEKMGISKGTVNVQLVKALKALKNYLAANGYVLELSMLIFLTCIETY